MTAATRAFEVEAPVAEASGPGARVRQAIERLLAAPDVITVTAIVLAATVICLWNLNGAPEFQDDEGTYAAQAVSVQRGDLAPYTYWYDHPPFGWVQLAALAWLPQLLEVGRGTDVEAMRVAMAAFSVATCVLVYLVCRRVGARLPFSVLAAGVYLLSPLSLELGRQVYLDGIATTWLLVAFWLALSPQRALWHHISAGVAFAIAVLSKITAAVLGPALLVALLDRTTWRGREFSIVGFLALGGLTIAVYPLMALLRGELISGPGHVSLQDAMGYQFVSRSGSGWIWDAGSHRFDLASSWIGIDPYLAVGGVFAGLVCLVARRTRWIPVAIACWAMPVVASQGYLPAMYVQGVLPFMAIAIGATADLTWHGLHRAIRMVAPGARIAGPALVAALITTAVVLIPVSNWVERDTRLMTRDLNADWHRTLEWAAANIPHDEVTLVPYSMWHDLNERGWNDPWTLVVLEKVDLDSRFELEHPDGWVAIDWIIEGPTVRRNIENLDLEEAGRAYADSEVVQSFGDWNVRRVIHPAPIDIE
ncbi:glycosyltransferase family 39 protein [Agromyces bauzanensis]|uniref:Glycosyltransferase RgtA/B/C/D-like domain-containing protein n=1 Tax=Agromyces bauzanensis TaxID=1308924 RepID=A0A917UNF2_9MICO|nr:glycosyltransferase family 39 protein [Agromyces bauzanensis]GGJ69844.1 hypothetical protein GCM10011372_04630 [Agromyces bauzanensis]